MTETDVVSPERSRVMRAVKGKNTTPEMAVRRVLHRLGYRFRLHDKRLEGRPDIVLRRYRTVIFVHGCFWHRHEGCARTRMPKTKLDFWTTKFETNVARDKRNLEALRLAGWKVFVVWECETKNIELLEHILILALSHLD